MKSIKKNVITYFPFLLITLCLSCLPGSIRTPAHYNFKAIDSVLINSIELNHIPGAVAYISHKGDEVYHKAFGYKNIAQKAPMKTKSLFRLASMTKAVTAVAILQLNEKALLQLDDPIKKYIPEFSEPTILKKILSDSSYSSHPAKSDITIRQLLTHTSGIGYGFQNYQYNKIVLKNEVSEGFCEDSRTSMENTRKIAKLPLLAEPGQKYIYGLSYDVLGTLIEVISGKRYDDYVLENIFYPLNMSDSYFIVPKEQQYRIADVYEPLANNNGIAPTTYKDINYPVLGYREFFSGGADMISTANDYNKFLNMLVNEGNYEDKKILSALSVKMMLTPQTSLNEGGSYQGFATWVVNNEGAKNGLRPEGSFDFGGFFDTYCWVDPEQEFTAILLLQMYPNNTHDVHWKFQKAVYKGFELSKIK